MSGALSNLFDKNRQGRGRVEDEPARVWPEELIEEARDLGISEDAIKDGGDRRENQYGVKYWLDLDHLVEFEKHDQSIDSNEEFWQWFRDYRDQHRIYSNYKGGVSKQTWRDRVGDWTDTYKDTGRNYVSKWWSGWGYSSGSEDSRRLAIALGAIQSIVSVINDTATKFTVYLASDDQPQAPTSYTAFDDRRVVVSPQALLDKTIDQEASIQITSGWGLHEASHVKYTVDVLHALRKPTVLTPLLVANHLLNLIEDVRIEANTSAVFPGFAGFFTKSNQYLWDIGKKAAPTNWGPELTDKLNAITAITKWNTEYAEILAYGNNQQLKDEFTWFSAWNARYQAGKIDARTALIEALDHLNEDPQTKKQMQQQSQEEAKKAPGGTERLTDDQFRRLLDDIRSGKGLIDPCPSPGGKAPDKRFQLSPEQAAEVNKLLQEKFREGKPQIGDSTGKVPMEKIHWTKPLETPASKAAYKRPTPLVAKMKQAFVFRKVTPDWFERLQRSGELDENMLWRVSGNDLRVFERRNTVDTVKMQVTLLIDLSGSMYGHKLDVAQELANTMLECLKTMRGVTVRVRGHSNMTAAADIYRIWEPGDPVTRIGLITQTGGGGTPDGLALDAVGHEMIEARQKDEDMVIIMLSDGMPNGSGSMHMTGPQYVAHVVKALEKKGVNVVQIAVDPSVSAKQQQMMYKHWIPFLSYDRLPNQLTRLLIKLFGGA